MPAEQTNAVEAAEQIIRGLEAKRAVLRSAMTCMQQPLSDGATSYRARPFDPASFAPVPFDRRLSAERGLVHDEGRDMRE